MHYPLRILFLCTHNSARSQMAEALTRTMGKGDFEAHSAGNEPSGIHPLAIKAMQEVNIDLTGQRSKHVSEYTDQQFDVIITVCDRARETCPTFPGEPELVHWSFEDPSSVEGDAATQLRAFRNARNFIRDRLSLWLLNKRKLLREAGYNVVV
ncbi:arsenate reductase ArsC [Candidatus Chloroploca sp. M-50]|uniref:Arsenate reductase ArsC n=1 Tax=Candidatus Chloroploca mongolica TaxID=2528176 RepID=A0ABS4DBW7_9CHLR|nr:arsenate reductase ArsC [Candidatus Chloroploca mongolica]MBP1466930.1 arsenate reductase ArsC [Candidatus Chloroploca mongolica]